MKKAEMAIPHLFMCPISLDLFKDPVTLCTGQTYDRSSIERWLAAGNLTCPVTMQKLHDLSMVPNHNLRHVIEEWLQTGHQFDPDYFKNIDLDPTLSALKHNLEFGESSLELKLQTLEKIHALSEELPSRNSSLIQQDFFPLLLGLIFRDIVVQREYLCFVDKALTCVQKLLPFSDLGCLNLLEEESKLACFCFLFEQGSCNIKKILCYLVEAISSSLVTRELCAIMGRHHKLLKAMVHLLHDIPEVSEAGLKAISQLCCTSESSRENLVQVGSVHGLLNSILGCERRGQRGLSAMAIETLEHLLKQESGKEAIINDMNGVNALVKMVFRVSDHEGSESAVNCLMIICDGSPSTKEEAIGAGVLTQLLLLLQSQCGGRTKAKARKLLKLLRSKDNGDPN